MVFISRMFAAIATVDVLARFIIIIAVWVNAICIINFKTAAICAILGVEFIWILATWADMHINPPAESELLERLCLTDFA